MERIGNKADIDSLLYQSLVCPRTPVMSSMLPEINFPAPSPRKMSEGLKLLYTPGHVALQKLSGNLKADDSDASSDDTRSSIMGSPLDQRDGLTIVF